MCRRRDAYREPALDSREAAQHQGRSQRPVPVRVRQKVQALLRPSLRRQPGPYRVTAATLPFNGRLPDECLNDEVFATLAEARVVIERWRLDYNHVRSHSAHGGLTPEAVRRKSAAGRLRDLISSAARPLPPVLETVYLPHGLSQ
jgi:putative transposase